MDNNYVYVNSFLVFSTDTETQIEFHMKQARIGPDEKPVVASETQARVVMALESAKQLRDALASNIEQHEEKLRAKNEAAAHGE